MLKISKVFGVTQKSGLFEILIRCDKQKQRKRLRDRHKNYEIFALYGKY